MVVANLLHNRNRFVTLVLKGESEPVEIEMSDSELKEGNEIEEKIVQDLTDRHLNYIKIKTLLWTLLLNHGEKCDSANLRHSILHKAVKKYFKLN